MSVAKTLLDGSRQRCNKNRRRSKPLQERSAAKGVISIVFCIVVCPQAAFLLRPGGRFLTPSSCGQPISGLRSTSRQWRTPQRAELGLTEALAATAVFAGVAGAFFTYQDAERGRRRDDLKKDLLDLVKLSQRGANEDSREEIERIFCDLEQLNPTAEPVNSPLLRADWELLWTTSPSILGLSRPPFFRPQEDKPILQFLDPKEGYARNLESTPLGPNRVEAQITPLSPEQRQAFTSKLDEFLLFKQGSQENPGGTYIPEADNLETSTVGVRFKVFELFGWLRITAPDSATGILKVTFLDSELRLSRGDRGNLFVLRKVSDDMQK
eukprot:TRINITY_DN64112_c0_g1_i1.p1 TRINITY_DN64112_c0_g1~~TRINITY_DN64112_c0_g1_i1.p1  ORF type:complete len:337 (-),score=51.34 TRINITY_DN64112_c0_g1_i1:52-1026(-)